MQAVERHLPLESRQRGAERGCSMENETNKTMTLQDFFDLASSKNIRVIEAQGLGQKSGLRYQKNGVEWLVLNSSMTEGEKIRAMGFLLEDNPTYIELDTAKIARQLGLISLQCPKG